MNIQSNPTVTPQALEVAATALLAPTVIVTAKPKVALAALSKATAQTVAKALVKAQVKQVKAIERSSVSLMDGVTAAALLAGTPLTEAQYDRQLKSLVLKAIKAAPLLSPTSHNAYASRFKAAVLALNSGDATLAPLAGEGWTAWHTRLAVALVTAKLPDGTFIREQGVTRSGAKAGVKVTPASSVTDLPVKATVSKGVIDDIEGGFNGRPAMAAALILTHQNASRAERLCIVMQSYVAEFDRWAATILTDADKREVEAVVAAMVAIPAPSTVPTAIASALSRAKAKANA